MFGPCEATFTILTSRLHTRRLHIIFNHSADYQTTKSWSHHFHFLTFSSSTSSSASSLPTRDLHFFPTRLDPNTPTKVKIVIMDPGNIRDESTENEDSLPSLSGASDTTETNTLGSSPLNFHEPALHSSFDSCSHPPGLLLPYPAINWSPLDEHFARMFHGWLDLPLNANAGWEEQVSMLRTLEIVIVPFEQAIGNSDEMFAAWRARHQAAMAGGLSVIPGWPQLHDATKGWIHEKWTERYRYLVDMREKLLVWRFHDLGLELKLARGPRNVRPARISKRKIRVQANSDRNCIPQHWYRSVEDILTEQAEKQGVDARAVITQFWTRPPLADEVPGLTNMSSESELSSPPVELRAMDCHRRPIGNETPTQVWREKRVDPELIKVESD